MILRLLILSSCILSAPLTAQVRWITSPVNGHFYARLNSYTSWATAETEAQRHGAHLVTIRSAAEQSWIESTFAGDWFWIGATDSMTPGTWSWSSGEPMVYTNWCGIPPNAPSGSGFCVMTSNWNACNGVAGKWKDEGTSNVRRAIIEINTTASYVTYRQSCPSSAGTPQLTSVTLPRIGTTLRLQVSPLAPYKIGALLFGFDDQTWQAMQLPFDLGAIGAPGCMLNIDPLIDLTSFADQHGIAANAIQIPNDPAYLGMVFYNQYVSFEAPAGRPLLLTTTNAGKGVIGN